MDCLHGWIGDMSHWEHASVFYYKPHPQDAIVCCSSKFVLHTIGDNSWKTQSMEGHGVPSSLDAVFSPKSQGVFLFCFVLFSFFSCPWTFFSLGVSIPAPTACPSLPLEPENYYGMPFTPCSLLPCSLSREGRASTSLHNPLKTERFKLDRIWVSSWSESAYICY